MEATLGKKPSVFFTKQALSSLPSGIQRWQKPAVLTYPDARQRKQIWELQQELSPTTNKNLASRLHLVNRWWDLMTLEGFSFRETSGCGWTSEDPSNVRAMINKALRTSEIGIACKLLDAYLGNLNKASRNWFADESPANENDKAWMKIQNLNNISFKNGYLELQGKAGKTLLSLALSFPSDGGINLKAGKQGFFKTGKVLSFQTKQMPGGVELATSDMLVRIEIKPFKLIVSDLTGKKSWTLNPGDLAFRINAAGEIIATDLKNTLLKNEAVFGFGEQFANVNHRGNVVTLWDMAANESIMFGLRNHAYKPVSLFHSTSGYTMFLNTSYRVRADVGFNNPDTFRLTSQGAVFDIFVWPTDPLKAVESYTSLTGEAFSAAKMGF